MISIELVLGVLLAASMFAVVQAFQLSQRGQPILAVFVSLAGVLGLTVVIVTIVEILSGVIPS